MAKKSKPARGLTARGAKGAPREKLAKAAGFRSDAAIAEQFPAHRHKHLRQLQQALGELASGLNLGEAGFAAVGSHYGALIRSLLDPAAVPPPQTAQASDPQPVSPRAEKQASVATEALRQMVLEAVASPLALLPSLLADPSLSDQDKLQRLGIYTTALEAIYDPLEIEAIGEPGEQTSFDPRLHDTASALNKGDRCTIRQIGFRRGDAVLRKAVVVVSE